MEEISGTSHVMLEAEPVPGEPVVVPDAEALVSEEGSEEEVLSEEVSSEEVLSEEVSSWLPLPPGPLTRKPLGSLGSGALGEDVGEALMKEKSWRLRIGWRRLTHRIPRCGSLSRAIKAQD